MIDVNKKYRELTSEQQYILITDEVYNLFKYYGKSEEKANDCLPFVIDYIKANNHITVGSINKSFVSLMNDDLKYLTPKDIVSTLKKYLITTKIIDPEKKVGTNAKQRLIELTRAINEEAEKGRLDWCKYPYIDKYFRNKR